MSGFRSRASLRGASPRAGRSRPRLAPGRETRLGCRGRSAGGTSRFSAAAPPGDRSPCRPFLHPAAGRLQLQLHRPRRRPARRLSRREPRGLRRHDARRSQASLPSPARSPLRAGAFGDRRRVLPVLVARRRIHRVLRRWKAEEDPLCRGRRAVSVRRPHGEGGTWNREGVILFAPGPYDSLSRVSAAGGTPVAVHEARRVAAGRDPCDGPSSCPTATTFSFWPGARWRGGTTRKSALWVGSLQRGALKMLRRRQLERRLQPPGIRLLREGRDPGGGAL